MAKIQNKNKIEQEADMEKKRIFTANFINLSEIKLKENRKIKFRLMIFPNNERYIDIRILQKEKGKREWSFTKKAIPIKIIHYKKFIIRAKKVYEMLKEQKYDIKLGGKHGKKKSI